MIDIVYPKHDMCWAMEVEWSHARRVHDTLRVQGVESVCVPGHRPSQDPSLIYSRTNLINEHLLPSECCKYIHRMFYVPYSCYDMSLMHSNSVLQDAVVKRAVFKVLASPKPLERSIVDVLIRDSDEDGNPLQPIVSPECIHPSLNTHIIHCIYSPNEGLFRWGITSKEESESYSLSAECLLGVVAASHSALPSPPVCRAYHKMQEIVEIYFPKWGWALPNKDHLLAVDVGASPGGWTQYIAPLCKRVLSIDPGEIRPCVRSLPTVTHSQHLAESCEAQQDLCSFTHSGESQYSPVSLCVCDVNFEGYLAADMLVESILPHMSVTPSAAHISLCHLCSAHSIPPLQSDCANVFSGSSVPSYLVLTLKLPKNPSQRKIESSFNSACRSLSRGYTYQESKGNSPRTVAVKCIDFKMIHLNANSRNERTLVCRVVVLS